ncbi:MAG: hypothetical protein JXR88_06570 [Clostridia bacterium]|nr:hypothetical protein [Clostridia bacterium]
MKKMFLILLCVSLTACSTDKINQSIPENKYDFSEQVEPYNIDVYIDQIDPVISNLDYIRMDSVFYDDENQTKVIITDRTIENILQIYLEYEKNHDTYDLINFFDLHVKKLSSVDVDILIYKIINKIEDDFDGHQSVVLESEFNDMIVDYITRITDTFLNSFEVSADLLNEYPDMYQYIDKLKRIVNGGYQIRRYEDQYYMFTDYSSFLLRYKDYYSEETLAAVEILVRESRNLVWINDILQVDNEAMAYRTDQIESFMKNYPNSQYYQIMRNYYVDYLTAIVSNPNNISVNNLRESVYSNEKIDEFNKIIERYSGSQMARILSDLVETIESNTLKYDEEKIAEIINKIGVTY